MSSELSFAVKGNNMIAVKFFYGASLFCWRGWNGMENGITKLLGSMTHVASWVSELAAVRGS